MANTNAPFGAKPAEKIRAIHTYAKGTATALYPGEFVIMGADGKLVVATAGSTQIYGVALGYATATDTSVTIADDPEQEYYIQDDGVSGTLAATSVGINADLVATAANVTFLKAKHQLDTNGITSATANLRILGFHPSDEIGKYVRCRVVINEHAFGKTTTGV
jgi:hypothetical protein